MLHESVKAAWHAFSEPLEGRVRSMYMDVKGLITTGVGNLIDPFPAARALPWKRADGTLATEEQVSDAWHRLKSHPEYAHRHVRHAEALTQLYLTDDDIDALVAKKLEENAAFITAHHFPLFPEFPADAQLGIMSMAWAVGPGFPTKFPTFSGFAERQAWEDALPHCSIRTEGNPGVIPRNRANRVCFANAEIVNRCGLARDILRWPNVAMAEVPQSEAPAFLGTLVPGALHDARIYAEEAANRARERASARDLLEDPADEITRPVNFGKWIA